MAKSLAYKLFGLGKVPKKFRPVLEREGMVLVDEGISGTMTLRRYKAPGRRHSYRKSWFVGSIVVTPQRIAAFALGRPIVNVPLDHEKLNKLHPTVDEKGRLVLEFEAADFDDRASGSVELRFATDQAHSVLELLS